MSIFPVESPLSPEQITIIASIFANSGQVALGSLVFSQLFIPFDNTKIFVLILGIGTTLLCWIMAIILVKKRRELYEI